MKGKKHQKGFVENGASIDSKTDATIRQNPCLPTTA
jgi:hypothetical protein